MDPHRSIGRPFASRASRRVLLLVLVSTILASMVALAATSSLIGDEVVHLNQAIRFAVGHFVATKEMTQIPGFHLVVAGVMRVVGEHSVLVGRVFSMVGMAFAFAAAVSIRRKVAPSEPGLLPAFQLLFLPIVFPYVWLFYTDVPSLALVLWTLRLSLDGRHRWAGVLGMAALLTRQVNVLWIALVALMELMRIIESEPDWRRRFKQAMALWPYASIGVVFVLYWKWNGAISFSRAFDDVHPDLMFGSGNIFFLLLLACGLFLPIMLVWWGRYVLAVANKPAWLLVPVIAYATFAYTYEVRNPYNYLEPNFIIRNRLLITAFVQQVPFLALGALATMAACGLSQVAWASSRFALVVPASLWVVSASDLIEQRYYIVPIALLLVLRRTESAPREHVLLATWMLLSVLITYGVLNRSFMV